MRYRVAEGTLMVVAADREKRGRSREVEVEKRCLAVSLRTWKQCLPTDQVFHVRRRQVEIYLAGRKNLEIEKIKKNKKDVGRVSTI